MTSQPASSDLSEIQPASSSEDASGQTVFAATYKNTAISKLMGETKGPSTTIPSSENTQAVQAPVQQSQHPQAIMAGHEPTVSQTAPTTERLQTVPGFDSKSPVQGQNMNTGGFRSSSGVPSEDELAQLYSNEAEGSQVLKLKSLCICMVPLVGLLVMAFCSKQKLRQLQFAVVKRAVLY